MDRHPYFTEIPRRSFEAIRLYGYLSEVLLALIVDPLEADDVARSIQEIYEGRIELVSENCVIDAPVRVDNFADLGLKAFESMKITVAQWVMLQQDADYALRSIAAWDHRLAVWCACAVAEECVRFVPSSYSAPSTAILNAKAWIGRLSTVHQAASAAASAWRIGEALEDQAAYSDESVARQAEIASWANAAYSASHAFYVTDDRALVVQSAARSHAARAVGISGDPGRVSDLVESETVRLREVIANACFTFPRITFQG